MITAATTAHRAWPEQGPHQTPSPSATPSATDRQLEPLEATVPYTIVRIPDPEAGPQLEERHVTVLPRSPLDTLRLLWREGHLKDVGVTALLGACATVAGYYAATTDDESLQAGNGAASGFIGALSLASLHHSVNRIRATLARDDDQRDEPARIAEREQAEQEAQLAQAIVARDDAVREALRPVSEDHGLFATTSRTGGYIEVAICRKALPAESQPEAIGAAADDGEEISASTDDGAFVAYHAHGQESGSPTPSVHGSDSEGGDIDDV
jgi:hypothetical protein